MNARNTKTKVLLRIAAVVVILAGITAGYVLTKHANNTNTIIIRPTSSVPSVPSTSPSELYVGNIGPRVYPNMLPVYNSRIFQQVGLLVSNKTPENPVILPLFGRKSPHRRERWEYYAATDKNTMLRIPIWYENRNCSEEVGCKEIYDGEIVRVPTYDTLEFKATIYKNL